MTRPDLTLPSRLPDIKWHQTEPMGLLDFAVYTLADLSDTEMDEVVQVAGSDIADNYDDGVAPIGKPEQFNFTGRSLLDIVESHLRLGHEHTFDAIYFVVVVSKNWRHEGLLLVALDDDDLECHPDYLFCKPDQTGLNMVNLQISNVGWDEVKESDDLDGGRNSTSR